MRTIREGEEIWQVVDGSTLRAEGVIMKGQLFAWINPGLTFSEWSSLCSWVEEKRKEGKLWKEG